MKASASLLLIPLLSLACSDDATVVPPDTGTDETATETGDGDGDADESGDAGDGDGDTETTGEPECGNGVVEDGEVCDDGNTDPADGCASDCSFFDCEGDQDAGDDDLDGICNDQDDCFGENRTGDVDNDGICADEDDCDTHYEDDSTVICGVIYVDASATGANDGSSWEDAFTQPAEAILASTSGDDIWVAAGMYTPPEPAMPEFLYPRHNTRMFGGFDGTETRLVDRAGLFDQTIISGDFNGDDDLGDPAGTMTDNAKRIFSMCDVAHIDGFVGTHAYANSWDDWTVGLLSTASDGYFGNIILRENVGAGSAGTIAHGPTVDGTRLVLEDVVIEDADTTGFVLWRGHADLRYVSYVGVHHGLMINGQEGGATVHANHLSMLSTGTAPIRMDAHDGTEIYNSAFFGDWGGNHGLALVETEPPTGAGICINQDMAEHGWADFVNLDQSTPELGHPFEVVDGRLYLTRQSTGGAADSACIGAGDMASFAEGAQNRSTASDGSAMSGFDAGAPWLP